MIVCSKSIMEDIPPAQQWVLPFPPKTAYYGLLTATACSTVLKTVGTASNRMGVGTSAIRHGNLDGCHSQITDK